MLKKHKLLVIIIVLIPIITLGYILYQKNNNTPAPQNLPATQEEKVNLEPATPEDLKRADSIKQENLSRDNKTSQQAGGSKSVAPIITYAGQYENAVEVGAYVNIYESGGKCTAKFANNNSSFTKTVSAVTDAKSVNCPVMSASSSEFNPKGSWTITVTYESSSSNGTSAPKQIEVR